MHMTEEVVYALYDFEAEADDELSFKAGEVIKVLEKDDSFESDGWWKGELSDGQVGIFPQSWTSSKLPGKPPSVLHKVDEFSDSDDDDGNTRRRKQEKPDLLSGKQDSDVGSPAMLGLEISDESEGDEDDQLPGLQPSQIRQDEKGKAKESSGSGFPSKVTKAIGGGGKKKRRFSKMARPKTAPEPSRRPEISNPKSIPSSQTPFIPLDSRFPLPRGPDNDDFSQVEELVSAQPSGLAFPNQAASRPATPSVGSSAARERDADVFSVGSSPVPSSNVTSATSLGSVPSDREKIDELAPRVTPVRQESTAPKPPIEWTTDEVLEWGRSKGFDDIILSKLREHDIAGDVLLGMNVDSLREIDLFAFGRRARVANEIKKLHQTNGEVSAPPAADFTNPRKFSLRRNGGSRIRRVSDPPAFASQETSNRSPKITPLPVSRQDNGIGLGAAPRRSDMVRIVENPQHEARENDFGVILSEGEQPSVPRLSRRKRFMGQIRNSVSLSESNLPRLKIPRERVASALWPSRSQQGEKLGTGEVSEDGRKTHAHNASLSVEAEPEASSRPVSRRSSNLFAFGGNNSNSSNKLPSPISAPSQPRRSLSSGIKPQGHDMNTDPKSLESLVKPEFSGWLEKRGRKFDAWKSRFVFLRGGYLYYLKHEGDSKPRGFIPLAGSEISLDRSARPGQCVFLITRVGQRAHMFSCPNEFIARAWIKAMVKMTIGDVLTETATSTNKTKTIPVKAAQQRSPRPSMSPELTTKQGEPSLDTLAMMTMAPRESLVLPEIQPLNFQRRDDGNDLLRPQKSIKRKPKRRE